MTQAPAGRVREVAERHAFALVLAAGLALRFLFAYVLFPGQGFRFDLGLHTGWLETIARVGPGGYYESIQEALPPGFPLVLWPFGLAARWLIALGAPPTVVPWAVVKLPAMLADGFVAALLYAAVRRWSGRRAGIVAAGLFLFIPITWYESALWSQIDSIGSLALLAALVLLDDGWSEGALAAAVVATLVKPQFAIAIFIVAIVLVRRHLLVPGSGPAPRSLSWLSQLAKGRVAGWLVHEQGAGRLASSAVAAIVVGAAMVLPFDIETRAPVAWAAVPLLGDLAGLLNLVTAQANLSAYLVANAYTPWALVGPYPLTVGGIGHWTPDSLLVTPGLTAFGLGVLLTAGALVVAGGALLWREDRYRIVAVFVFLSVAVFVLPTRVHERYVYPAFVVGAPLAAVSRRWLAWYVALGAANLVNLHAVLVHGATAGLAHLPFGTLAQSGPAIWVVALTMGALSVAAVLLMLRGAGASRLGAGRTMGRTLEGRKRSGHGNESGDESGDESGNDSGDESGDEAGLERGAGGP